MVKVLLDCGANVSMADRLGRTPLLFAAAHGRTEIQLLIDRGADVNAATVNKVSPLHVASCNRDLAVVKMLLDTKRADAKQLDDCGQTCLFWAICGGDIRIIDILVTGGCDVNESRCFDRLTPLAFACKPSRVDIVKTLLEHGANINAVDRRGRTPLRIAAEENRVDFIRVFAPTRRRYQRRRQDQNDAASHCLA